MAISNKQIKKQNDKIPDIPKRKSGDISKDFKNFVDCIENNKSNNNKIDFNQKMSSEQIIDLMNRLQFEQLAKNIFIDRGVKLTIKPQTTLFQAIRLYGHTKYIKGSQIDLNNLDIEPEKSDKLVKKSFF